MGAPLFLIGLEIRPGHSIPQRAAYPFDLPWLPTLNLQFRSAATILVGENGSGKSTLLKSLAEIAGLPGAGGTRNELADHHFDEPAAALGNVLLARFRHRPERGFYYRADTARGFADLLEKRRADPDFRGDPFAAYGGKSLHSKSSGQAAIARFRAAVPPSFVLLDEPENGLSLVNQLALGKLVIDWVRAGSQVIMATHSVALLGIPGATLIDFDDPALPAIAPEATTHWTIARRILLDPDYFHRVVDTDGTT